MVTLSYRSKAILFLIFSISLFIFVLKMEPIRKAQFKDAFHPESVTEQIHKGSLEQVCVLNTYYLMVLDKASALTFIPSNNKHGCTSSPEDDRMLHKNGVRKIIKTCHESKVYAKLSIVNNKSSIQTYLPLDEDCNP